MRIAAVAVTAANAGPAAASYLYYPDDAPDAFIDAPPPRYEAPRHRHPKHTQHTIKPVVTTREGSKPHGPVIVAISIGHQSMKIYDDNGLFAETPVSTGMRGHATPLGVFSVIQKQTWHESNIYSGAPMPYMQRITWSGIAIHAGVLPGYPASHGCIRMPMNFAVKMFHWTRMGARVIVTPGDVAPVAISHPLLITHKPEPIAAATPDPMPDPAANRDGTEATRTADAGAAAASGASLMTVSDASPNLELRSTIDVPSVDPAQAVSPPAGTVDTPAAAVSKPTGPIAVFVSRKDSKLYVRQNFTPLFDVPVVISPSDRPLGTHVFTTQADGASGSFRWSVVTIPTARRAENESARAHARTISVSTAANAESSPDTPSEALDRLEIPADAMTRIAQALTPGSSMVVSDQGVASGETGKGTDFIVLTR